ncbi:MAG: hypothetical protein ABIF06_01965, partial [bacterium]
KIKNSEWICNINKLKDLLKEQKEEIAFYCGVASSMDDYIPLFDKVVLLKASTKVLYKRLTNREGTGDMGTTEASRQTVLGWKDWWENQMKEKGAIVVPADGNPTEVTKEVIKVVS